MSGLLLKFFILLILSLSPCTHTCSPSTCCPQDYIKHRSQQFQQKTSKFWEFDEQSKSWVEVKLPSDLVSCVNDNCTKVGSIKQMIIEKTGKEKAESENFKIKNGGKDSDKGVEEKTVSTLPLRKKVSLIKMSEASVWVTGVSGSIYERFWNGLQWVIAPHDLLLSAGSAIASFIVNQTVLALSDAGNLYEMQLGETSEPVWVEFQPVIDHFRIKETDKDSAIKLRRGVISHDRERIYFCTKNGLLFELNGIQPPSWINHGRPPGGNVAAIADVGTVKQDIVFTVSSTGDLYEFDINSKPMWKKHIWIDGSKDDTSLMPSLGFCLHGIYGGHSISLFLLTKGGKLVERQLRQRKWKWIVHGSPKHQFLTSITPVSQSYSLFLTTETGFVFEYQIPKHSGAIDEEQNAENWVNHMHPPHAKVAKGIAGLEFQVGRLIFPLDDGRLGELHFPGIGGEGSGPYSNYYRRKEKMKHIWSILDAPETEGWNADYCTEVRGPSNCIIGINDEADDAESTRSVTRRRKGGRVQQNYLIFNEARASTDMITEDYSIQDKLINTNFRLRVTYKGRSFFLITDSGLIFEYLSAENMWLWMRHEHSKAMKGVLGSYNGSLFVVDEQKNLHIRERSSNELEWINCTAMKRGKHVVGGPPWDAFPAKDLKVTAEDALFFVSKSGRLLQLTVAMRRYKWKDCKHPQNTKIASIVDQEIFRRNIVFVVGRDSRLYQYNKVTELWHEHYQSQHLVLSRAPGTATHPTPSSLTGSLFMLSEDGKLIEYHWNMIDGWKWIEHGTPHISVALVGSPGPCFLGNELFLVGSNGKVYLRYLESPAQSLWKWKDYSFPYVIGQAEDNKSAKDEQLCINEDATKRFEENLLSVDENCDPKIAATRPIPFAEDSVIFELRDGRLGELKLNDDGEWAWWRIIGTPTSLCMPNYWTALAS